MLGNKITLIITTTQEEFKEYVDLDHLVFGVYSPYEKSIIICLESNIDEEPLKEELIKTILHETGHFLQRHNTNAIEYDEIVPIAMERLYYVHKELKRMIDCSKIGLR